MDETSILICELASQLEVTELELFENAFRYWHQEEPNPQGLESLYGQFLMNKTSCPHWVRDYCRRLKAALEDNDMRALWDLAKIG